VKNGNQHLATENDHATFNGGSKSDFRKVTVTLPQQIYELVVKECARRKVEGKKNHLISSLVREAVAKYLEADFGR
jgi:transcriptional regulator of met regulon